MADSWCCQVRGLERRLSYDRKKGAALSSEQLKLMQDDAAIKREEMMREKLAFNDEQEKIRRSPPAPSLAFPGSLSLTPLPHPRLTISVWLSG